MPIEFFYLVRSAFLFKISLAQTSLVFAATSIGIGPGWSLSHIWSPQIIQYWKKEKSETDVVERGLISQHSGR